MKKKFPFLPMAAAMALTFPSASSSARAANATWTGGGANNTWTAPTNWGGTAPVAGDSLIFSGTTRTTPNNNFTSNTSFGGISFTNNTTGQTFTLSGNQITLGGDISTATVTTGSITDTISLAMILSGNRTITTNTNHNLVTGLTSTISESAIGSTLTKTGAASLTLNGNNTFTGNMFINQGSVLANTLANSGSSSSIGAGNAIVFAGGGLTYTGGGATTNRTVTLTGSAGTLSTTGTGALVYTGALSVTNTTATSLTLAGTSTSNNEFQSAITNGASSAVSLTKGGVSTWILSGNNTYTGGTTVSGGILEGTTSSLQGTISNNATVTFNQSSNGTYSGNMSGNGTLIKNGTGKVTLGGANTYTGNTTINAGTLQVGVGTDAGSIGSTSAIINNGALVYNVGNGTRTLAANISGSGTLTQSSTGGTLTLSGNNTYGGQTFVTTGTLVVDAAGVIGNGGVAVTGGELKVNGTIGNGALTVSNGAILSGTGTIAGATTISGKHNPGNSPGIQTFGSDLAYTGGNSTVTWELKGNTTTNAANPNAVFDTIVVGGNLDFTGATALTLSFTTAGSSVLWADTFWDTDKTGSSGWLMYQVTGTTTNFANLSLNVENWLDSGSNAFDTVRPNGSFSLFFDNSGGNNNVYLNYTAVPEPAAWILAALGLTATVVFRRRRA